MAKYKKYSFKKYSERYKQLFNKEKAKLKKIFPRAKIEHVGSSSIRGLGGKGIIDIAISVPKNQIQNAIKKLQRNGYDFRPKGGDKERCFFQKIIKYCEDERRVHIQLTHSNSKTWKSMLAVRDYLRKNPKAIKEYERVKKEATKYAKNEGKKYREYKKSSSTINLYLQAIRYALIFILNKRNIFVNLPTSKKPEKLPIFLTESEVILLINSIKNKKHKIMIELLYSAGLRVSELINLKIEDLDFDSNSGWIRGGKGNKDRLFIIAKKIKDKLKEEIKCNKNYVFERNHKSYSSRTIYEIIKKTGKIAGIKKKIHPHTLRHSFATHLIQKGYSMIAVQSLMGHKSPETTMIYVHMAKPKFLDIESPYDSI